jgi:hypothetical protein
LRAASCKIYIPQHDICIASELGWGTFDFDGEVLKEQWKKYENIISSLFLRRDVDVVNRLHLVVLAPLVADSGSTFMVSARRNLPASTTSCCMCLREVPYRIAPALKDIAAAECADQVS